MRKRLALLALLLSGAAFAQQPPARPEVLRVCADPDNLPLSHEDGSGFENRIAQLLADDWKVPLRYAWLPDRRGFVRKTLGENACDVIIGVPVEFERVVPTRPYYRSAYVLVDRAGSEPPVTSFDDPRLKRMHIGVQLIGNDLAASPPGLALARHGSVSNVAGFPIVGEEPSAARMVRALERGEVDALFVWGPQVGWHAGRAKVPLRVTPLAAPADLPREVSFEFDIGMGVRRGDRALRAALDDFIQRRRADIERILDDYAVPRRPLP